MVSMRDAIATPAEIDNSAETVQARRNMFASFGWSTSEPAAGEPGRVIVTSDAVPNGVNMVEPAVVDLAALVGEAEIVEHQSADAGPMPYNAVTGVQYKGGNIMRLLLTECEHSYGDGGWAGYKQWLSIGRVVRKGERGTQCMTVVRVTDDKGRETTKPRGFRVFHFDQTTELDAAEDGAA